MSHAVFTHHYRSASSSKRSVFRPSRSGLPRNHSSGRLQRTAKSKSSDSLLDHQDDGDMIPTGFHQFCTTCEKQLAIPNNAFLYCSESRIEADSCPHSCRRHDSTSSAPSSPASALGSDNAPSSPAASVSASEILIATKGKTDDCNLVTPAITGPSSTDPATPSPLSEYEAFIGRPLLSRRRFYHPQRHQYIASPPPTLASPVSAVVLHSGKSDMDPTEWKPDGERTASCGNGLDSSAVTTMAACTSAPSAVLMADQGSTSGHSTSKAAVATILIDKVMSSEDGLKTDPTDHDEARPSDAFVYLSQFHRSAENFAALSRSSSSTGISSGKTATRGKGSKSAFAAMSLGAASDPASTNSDAPSSSSSSSSSSADSSSGSDSESEYGANDEQPTKSITDEKSKQVVVVVSSIDGNEVQDEVTFSKVPVAAVTAPQSAIENWC